MLGKSWDSSIEIESMKEELDLKILSLNPKQTKKRFFLARSARRI